jgi:hypothetical protein
MLTHLIAPFFVGNGDNPDEPIFIKIKIKMV